MILCSDTGLLALGNPFFKSPFDNMGTVIFARSDKKDLTSRLFRELQGYIFELMENPMHGWSNHMRETKLKINPESFQAYMNTPHKIQEKYNKFLR
jgi:hypothetical protein